MVQTIENAQKIMVEKFIKQRGRVPYKMLLRAFAIAPPNADWTPELTRSELKRHIDWLAKNGRIVIDSTDTEINVSAGVASV